MAIKSDGKWPPRKCEMPDLKDLRANNTLNYILNLTFRGGGPSNSLSASLVKNFIRIVDYLIDEYNYSQASLLQYVNTPNVVMGPLFKAIGHMETCLGLLKRAINFAEKIQKDINCPPIDRKLSVLSKTTKEKITDLRNKIEHLEKDLIKGTIEEGEPITLLVKCDCVELTGIKITYKELAVWIRELYELAGKLAIYSEEAGKA